MYLVPSPWPVSLFELWIPASAFLARLIVPHVNGASVPRIPPDFLSWKIVGDLHLSLSKNNPVGEKNSLRLSGVTIYTLPPLIIRSKRNLNIISAKHGMKWNILQIKRHVCFIICMLVVIIPVVRIFIITIS